MRVISALLFTCAIVVLYFGMGMFLFFYYGRDKANTILLDGGLMLMAALLLSASGWFWFRAKRADFSLDAPEKAQGQSGRQIWKSAARHMIAFCSAGFLLVFLVIVGILCR